MVFCYFAAPVCLAVAGVTATTAASGSTVTATTAAGTVSATGAAATAIGIGVGAGAVIVGVGAAPGDVHDTPPPRLAPELSDLSMFYTHAPATSGGAFEATSTRAAAERASS